MGLKGAGKSLHNLGADVFDIWYKGAVPSTSLGSFGNKLYATATTNANGMDKAAALLMSNPRIVDDDLR